jgi:hypothetical protein
MEGFGYDLQLQTEEKIVLSAPKEEEEDDEEEDDDSAHAPSLHDAATGQMPVGKSASRLGKKEKGGGKVELDAKKVTGQTYCIKDVSFSLSKSKIKIN